MPVWSRWLGHFEKNRIRPLPELSDAGRALPAAVSAQLARSLAVFQLGESKGGRLAREIDAARLPGIDDDYRAAVKLFVGEEQRHGELLAGCVRALGGRLIGETWSETLFVGARRLFGLRGKLVILCAAEVIGLGFYRSLCARLPAGPLRSALDEICRDEDFHLAFHRDFWKTQLATPAARAAFAAAWWLIAGTAALVVAFDHRRTLAALGVGQREALGRFAELIAAQLEPRDGVSPI